MKIKLDEKTIEMNGLIIDNKDEKLVESANFIIDYLEENGVDEEYGDGGEAYEQKQEIIANVVAAIPFPILIE